MGEFLIETIIITFLPQSIRSGKKGIHNIDRKRTDKYLQLANNTCLPVIALVFALSHISA